MAAVKDWDPENYLAQTKTGNVLYEHIYKRCNYKNKHFIGVITGREGSGKSYTSLSIAKQIDPTFDVNRVYFRLDNLLEVIKDGQLDSGSALMIDEAGVGLGSRTWYEKEQIHVNQVLQLIRNENLAIFATLPSVKELDSQARNRLLARIEMLNIEEHNNMAVFKWHNLSPKRGFAGNNEPIKRFPTYTKNGLRRKLKKLRVPKPPDGLIEDYEKKKSEFQQQEYQKVIDELREDESDNGEIDIDEIAQEITKNGELENYKSIHRGNQTEYINKDLLRDEFDLSHSQASALKAKLEQLL